MFVFMFVKFSFFKKEFYFLIKLNFLILLFGI